MKNRKKIAAVCLALLGLTFVGEGTARAAKPVGPPTSQMVAFVLLFPLSEAEGTCGELVGFGGDFSGQLSGDFLQFSIYDCFNRDIELDTFFGGTAEQNVSVTSFRTATWEGTAVLTNVENESVTIVLDLAFEALAHPTKSFEGEGKQLIRGGAMIGTITLDGTPLDLAFGDAYLAKWSTGTRTPVWKCGRNCVGDILNGFGGF